MKLKYIIFFAVIFFSTNIFSQNSDFSDTEVVVPPDYEKALADLMSSLRENRSAFNTCKTQAVEPIYCPDSVYIDRLQKLPYRIEMPYNSIVRAFIDRYAKSIRQVAFMAGLGEQFYFHIFENALAKYDLPQELKYLPIIESALNNTAVSYVGAGGLWQFMVATGKIYDLEVNSLVDERYDPAKASDAAARYLRDLYTIYEDWHLVIAAYNCGPGNVARAVRKAGGKKSYWDIYPYLPRETRGYVPIFIAANYIMNYYPQHNICPTKPAFAPIIDTVSITSRIHFEQIASVLNIPIEELRFLNPQYKRDIIPGNIKEYHLALPLTQVSAFYENIDTIIAYRSEELTAKLATVEPAGESAQSSGSGNGKLIYYKVRSGDSLGVIASRNRVTVAQLKRWNGLRSNMIHAGQKLKIYK
ncbi:MAG: transglycosylase SLT domain-containing protein [Prevotellaceae bacterium]|jgi:membrane-bound lytic murein transglycosylase D|nr:transglycosylase SLT domain-containing protein [Prevotellaceae bacterium]